MNRDQNPPPPMFQAATITTVGDHNGIVILHISGEVDLATSPELEGHVDRVLRSAPSVVIVDLSGVTFLGSTGIGLLLKAQEQAQQTNTDLLLAAAQRVVLRPIEISGLTAVFRIHHNVSQAVAAANFK
jgi:anti-sigma B factor antagonist